MYQEIRHVKLTRGTRQYHPKTEDRGEHAVTKKSQVPLYKTKWTPVRLRNLSSTHGTRSSYVKHSLLIMLWHDGSTQVPLQGLAMICLS